ncbi:putative nitronate monooxygenase [Bienertia sinuspersici]
MAFPHDENLKVILEEKVAVLQLYWGEVSEELVHRAHDAGIKVVPQVGSIGAAKRAIDVGVDAIIVQGREAGGHVMGRINRIGARIVDLIGERDIPVIAAGGIVDARGYVAALALGARGVALGTRFLATEESNAHPVYKKKLVEYSETEYTDVFGRARWPGAPQRVLLTPFYNDWRSLPENEDETNQPVIGHSTIHGVDKDVRRFAGTVPNKSTTGDVESMAMYAGQGVGLIREILPAGEVVKKIVDEAQLLVQQKFKDV